jgi:hypothetical protein
MTEPLPEPTYTQSEVQRLCRLAELHGRQTAYETLAAELRARAASETQHVKCRLYEALAVRLEGIR